MKKFAKTGLLSYYPIVQTLLSFYAGIQLIFNGERNNTFCIRKTSFLTDAAVNLVTIFQLVSVVRLDVSFTENLSSKGLAKLVEFFPCLEKLNLEYCKGVSNMSLASLAAVTPCLTHLYLADAPINGELNYLIFFVHF